MSESKRKVTSFRLSTLATRQLAELTDKLEMNQSEIVSTALDRLYQQETQTMTTQQTTLTIHSVETKPKHDPYSNISGIVSHTVLKLDPRDNTVWVTQEYNDNSTPSDEWHGLVLTWSVPDHPTENAMREWIEKTMSEFATICNGYESIWDGSNHVGRLSDEARATKDAIEEELNMGLDYLAHYEYWTVEQWIDPILSDISATTTDDELRQIAQDSITALDANQTLDTNEDGIYDYIKAHRDELIDE